MLSISLWKTLLRDSYLHEARCGSSYTRHIFRIFATFRLVPIGSSIYLSFVRDSALATVSSIDSSKNGCLLKYRKQSRHPADQRSHLAEYGSHFSYCGDEQIAVPFPIEKVSILVISSEFSHLAQPKSAIFISPLLQTRMFQGLRSLWIMPCAFIVRKALVICLKIFRIYSVSIFLFFLSLKYISRSPSSQYSIRICREWSHCSKCES